MWYDWGHKEEPLFMEFLWQIRATNRNLKTREWAVDQMRVDRNRRHNFWKKVCPDPNVAFLYVTESHKDIFDMLKGLSFGNMSVWNFDAHNDLSYSNRTTKECDNWAWWALQDSLIQEYHIVYPEWRLQDEEDFPIQPSSLHYEIPAELPPRFDAVFVCRSSAWTPSWCDDAWLRFVGHWKAANPNVWKHRRTLEFVQKKRFPNLQQAKRLREEHLSKFLDQIYREEARVCHT
jgi:hypothetical protein